MTDILKLYFEGDDPEPSPEWRSCILDTAEHYSGNSSLRLNGVNNYFAEVGYLLSSGLYTYLNYTFYFRFNNITGFVYTKLSFDGSDAQLILKIERVGGNLTWGVNVWDRGDNEVINFAAACALSSETWHKMELVVDDSNIIVYINDVELTSGVASIQNPLSNVAYVHFYNGSEVAGDDFWVDQLSITSSGTNFITTWTNADPPDNFATLTTDGPDITACTDFTESDGQAYTNNLGLAVGSECTLVVVLTKNNSDTWLNIQTSSQINGSGPSGSILPTELIEGTNTFNFTATTDDVYLVLIKNNTFSEPDFSCTFYLQGQPSEPPEPVVDLLKLNFEGSDEATTWTEEAQDLTPTTVVGKCIIDTTLFYDGTSSLELNYEETFVDPLWVPEKRIIYTVPNIEADFECTVYFRFHGIDTGGWFAPIILYKSEESAYFDCDFYLDGSDTRLWIGGTDSLGNAIGTNYDEITTLSSDAWHKLYVKVLDRDILVEIDNVEIVTLTATMDDPLLGIDTVEFSNYNTGTGNSVWLDKILMSNGISGGGGVVLATVETQEPTYMYSSSLVFNGAIISTGGENVTRRGVCYVKGNSGNPTISNSVVYDDGSFESNTYTKTITGLLIATNYRIRAYAVNSAGVSYGLSRSVTTLDSMGMFLTNKVLFREPDYVSNVAGIDSQYIKSINGVLWRTTDVPIVYASQLSVTSSGISMIGDIRDVGLDEAAIRGFCYIPTASGVLPTTNDFVVYGSGSFGLGEYSMDITGLDENTNYTIRAFTTNSAGTSYGAPIYVRTDNLFMDFAYFGTNKSSGDRVIEIRLSDFTKTGSLLLPSAALGDGLENDMTMLRSAAVDIKNRCGYFGSASEADGKDIIKVNLLTLYKWGLRLSGNEHVVRSAAIDQTNGYAYFGLDSVPGKIAKVNLSTFTETAMLSLTGDGENRLYSAVIDDDNGFAYFGTGVTVPGPIIKVDLSTFTRVGAVYGESYHRDFTTAVIDKPNGFAYFGTDHVPGRIVRIDLSDFTYAGEIELSTGEDYLRASVIDQPNGFAYFMTATNPGKIIKIQLSDFTKVDTYSLNSGEIPGSAVIDQLRGFIYLGTGSIVPGKIIKIDLTSFTSLGSITLLESESIFGSAVII